MYGHWQKGFFLPLGYFMSNIWSWTTISLWNFCASDYVLPPFQNVRRWGMSRSKKISLRKIVTDPFCLGRRWRSSWGAGVAGSWRIWKIAGSRMKLDDARDGAGRCSRDGDSDLDRGSNVILNPFHLVGIIHQRLTFWNGGSIKYDVSNWGVHIRATWSLFLLSKLCTHWNEASAMLFQLEMASMT
jgi:hypothetical protein